jgi:hypothetical protein
MRPSRGTAWGATARWAILLGVACSCGRSAPTPPPTVHTLRLPVEDVTLPDHPGRDQVTSSCAVCHSPRYVLDQPPLPRKTWEAEVDKMRKVYGAPVRDEDVAAIVDYLVAVRGG